MTKTAVQFSLMFVVLVVAQAVVFNRLDLFSVALAFVFIYFIIKLPITLSASWVMLLSFLLGVSVDIFSDTPGMNALACTCLGGCRRTVMRLYVPREDDVMHRIPSSRTLGGAVFSKYVVTMSLTYCILVFCIEAFTFFRPLMLMAKIVASTLLTSLIILLLDSITAPRTAFAGDDNR